VKQIRKRLTYANAVSSLALFLVLGGATAIAASKIGSHQLKANSVTTAKIKKNAVTATKIKKNAITTGKIKNAAVTGEKINAETTPFARVVAKMRGNASLALTKVFQNYPLSPTTYTQGAEEDDSYLGAVDVTFEPGCGVPRSATALVLADPTNATKVEPEESIVALGVVTDKTGGTVSKRIQVPPFIEFGTRFEPGTPTTHTLNLVVEGECETGSGIKATAGAVDVIGTK
jgi:hypothetical protein